MELLEQHFDLAFAAPNGVQKLRELILTFAMQGKLVPQDPNAQPASELLREIEAEKQKLVEKGEIKQAEPLPRIEPQDIAYELPKGWEWVRLGEVANYNGRKNINSDEILPETWLLDLEDIEKDTSRIIYCAKYSERQSKSTKSTFKEGDVLYGKLRPYLNKVVVADAEGVCTTEIVPIVPIGGIDSHFLKWLLKRPSFLDHVNTLMYGVKMPRLGTIDAVMSVHPLPPLSEQRRIVAKIDRLMARCDELEKLRGDRNQKRITIHTAALNRLLTAKESNDFSTAWHFITQHFGELYSVKENVAELRKAILQLAVMGKLVPQEPKDEPASELLKQNQKLIAEAKGIQKTIPELRTTEAKIPFGWARCQLADVALVVMGNSPPGNTYNDDGEGVPLINGPVEFSRGAFGLTLKTKYTTAPSRLCQKGDLLVCVRGATTGRTNIAAFDACIGRGVGLVRGWEAQQYLNYLLWHLGQQLLEQGKGTTFPSIAYADLAGLEIWLPPLAEQRRIVAKIDQLMALCNRLEKQIDAATSKRTELLNALMAQV